MPRLLVSVRDASEAVVALLAGVDLLDCKEPHRGSLGRPSAAMLREVIAARDQSSPQTPVSVALGELAELSPEVADTRRGDAYRGIQYIKLGLSELVDNMDWRNRWRSEVRRIRASSPSPPQVVAVAYADADAARSPAIGDVLATACELDCAGLLFDTWSKSGGRLLTHLAPPDLARWAERIHAAGLFVAVAGQLQSADLAELSGVPVDVVAVRSAVCAGHDRRGRLSGALVSEFSAALRRTGRSTV